MKEVNENLIDKKKREDLVLGIFSSAALGFLVNILSNLFYESYIKELPVSIGNTKLFFLLSSLILVIGFLFFLIDDYKNVINLNKKFLKRFVLYLGYKFKITSYAFKSFLFLVAISGVGLMVGAIISAFISNIYVGIAVTFFSGVIIYKDILRGTK